MWFVYSIIGYILLALVFILDKRILSSGKMKPVVYTFYSTIFLLATAVCWGFGVPLLTTNISWMLASVSGAAFVIALWTMFIGVKQSAASRLDPFIGAIITIATFLGSSLFFKEIISTRQLFGIVLLVIASIVLSFEKIKNHHRFHAGYWWGVLSGAAFALSDLAAKAVYVRVPFWPGFVATRVMIGACALVLLFSPQVWKSFLKPKKSRKKNRHNPLPVVGLNKVLSIIGNTLIQLAIAQGSITVVKALSGLQYALMFGMIEAASYWWPTLFFEYTTRRELRIQTLAILFVVIGLVLVV